MELEKLVKAAVDHYTKMKAHLPVTFISIIPAGNSTNTFYRVIFIDNKIEDVLKKVFSTNIWYANHFAKFEALIYDSILEPGTIQDDLLAKIPSYIDEEKKMILRIAWNFHKSYRRHIFDTYQMVEKEATKHTWANAKKWYDNLK